MLEKPTPHWTWHKPTTARTLTQIETNTRSTWQEASLSRSHLSIPGNNKHSRLQHGSRRSYYHKSFIDGRSREVLYSTLLVACKRTSSDFYGKRTNFSFDRAENMDSVQSDPRVVFSVADVLACHRETRWYCTQITLALSSLLPTLACHQQTRDRRFSADALASSSPL